MKFGTSISLMLTIVEVDVELEMMRVENESSPSSNAWTKILLLEKVSRHKFSILLFPVVLEH